MGVILSRFRKKKSTLEVLEGLEKDIKSIEEYGQTTERKHKAVVGRLVLVSVGLYVLTACLFYFFFFPASMYDQLLYVIPLLLFPVIIIFVKRLVSWWYRRKISRNQEKLGDMKKQKKELLEEVMDKETYKVARQILEKFAPEQLRKTSASTTSVPSRPVLEPGRFSHQLALNPKYPPGSGTELRRRPIGAQLAASVDSFPTRQVSLVSASPRSPPSGVVSPGNVMSSESSPLITAMPRTTSVSDPCGTSAAFTKTAADAASTPAAADKPDVDVDDPAEEEDIDNNGNVDEAGKHTTGAEVADRGDTLVDEGLDERLRKGGLQPISPRLARPIIPRERSVMDRLVEYLVGDGVNQRYALICSDCGSHNGMALKEEFEYLAFRCCYCFHWNPARKQRLHAPRIEAPPSSGNTTTSSSPAESNTEEEDDESMSKSKNMVSCEEEEEKSELRERKLSTCSSEGIYPAIIVSESTESRSSTEAEFESLVPDPISDIPSGRAGVENTAT